MTGLVGQAVGPASGRDGIPQIGSIGNCSQSPVIVIHHVLAHPLAQRNGIAKDWSVAAKDGDGRCRVEASRDKRSGKLMDRRLALAARAVGVALQFRGGDMDMTLILGSREVDGYHEGMVFRVPYPSRSGIEGLDG